MKRSLQQLLAEGRLRRQPVVASEVRDLFALADRDLADARITLVSADRRFATAYNAALQLATVLIRADGFRSAGQGHHQTTIAAVPLILGSELQASADFLDACRSKRNSVDYDRAGIVTERDIEELIAEGERLRTEVVAWLATRHPDLAASDDA